MITQRIHEELGAAAAREINDWWDRTEPAHTAQRAVRWSHRENSWQVNRPEDPRKFENTNAHLARCYVDMGFAVRTQT